MSALLEVRGLRKAYGERLVLDDVSLSVAAGDVVCLIGSSGSGKSTLLRCLDLLEPVDDGTIHLDGVEITAYAGQTIMEAADEAGVYIPRLCDHEGLRHQGSCRGCTVKAGSSQ